MATDEKWYFTKERLANTPSRRCGIDGDKELSYRQQSANLIQDMGQRLMVSQLCINTAIVYMHRFYVFHSLTHFHRNYIAAAALFLAAKVEEQPRKLEHVIKVAFMCLHKDIPHPQQLDPKSEQYLELSHDLVFNENALLQTLGFDVAIDHPHTHVVRCCHLVKAGKDLAQASYFMASNSLHLTTMCLQYKPTIVACFCIHLACKWSNWEIPQSNEGKDWFWYVDKSVTSEMLMQLTGEFLHIFDKCPSRLKRKIRSISATQTPSIAPSSSIKSPFDNEPRKIQSPANSEVNLMFGLNRAEVDASKKAATSRSSRTVDYREYQEKRERERIEREKAAAIAATGAANADPNKHHSHHHKQSSSGMAMPGKHSSSSAIKQTAHHNHHHKQDVKSSSQMIQRHSSSGSNSSSGSGGARELLREKQRLQREYTLSSSSGYSSHNHSLDNLLESGLIQDSQTSHPPEKLNNSVHKSHSNDVRHGKQHQKETKLYSKYADPAAAKTYRKDPIEHRTEEVRKLIEKPLPPPKPRPEVMIEEYAAMMLKSSHHPSKYQQPEKPTPSVSTSQASLPSLGPESKMMNVGQTAFTTEKSPNAPVSAAQISQKSLSASKGGQAKNGNAGVSATASFSLVSSYDEPKVEKRPREENAILTNKHRSLFSPEKTITPPNPKDSHTQRHKKQKTSPAIPKQDHSLTSANIQVDPLKQRSINSLSSASQKQHRLNTESSNLLDHDSKYQHQENHSRRHMANFGLSDTPGLNSNRVPELIQPIKDSMPSSKSLAASAHGDVKQTADNVMSVNQRVKSQPIQQNQTLNNGLHSSLAKQEFSLMDPSTFVVKPEPPEELFSNEGPSDFMFSKQEQKVNYMSYQEPMMKPELNMKQEFSAKQELGMKQESSMRQNSFSPLKTAQSIGALLQENLGSMSPILQVPSFEQHQQQSHSVEEDKEPQLPSTVDMSELVAPMHCAMEIPVMATMAPVPALTTASVTSAPAAEEKKSEHHSKSEKKKKEKKHKHKEKDKSKDKHKHKHKEKDKDKHRREKADREKDVKTDDGSSTSGNSTALGAVPIKITIPKDKLNLSGDSIGTSASSTPSSGLKIKIPKERLKGSDVTAQQLQQSQAQQSVPHPQAPLKIKIRTDTLARNAGHESQPTAGRMQQHQQQPAHPQADVASRKRERTDASDNLAMLGAPPSKKQQLQPPPPQQQQRPNERQNGRHSSQYNMPGNNKTERLYDVDVNSGEAVDGHPKNFVPSSHGSFPSYY